jgi:hypothetical protein
MRETPEERYIVLLPHSSEYQVICDDNFWAVPFSIIFEIKIKQSEFKKDKDGHFIAPVTIKNQQCYLILYGVDFRRVFGLSNRKTIVKETIGYLQSFKDYGDDYDCTNKNAFKFLTNINGENYPTWSSIYVKVFSDENSDHYKYQLAKIKQHLNKAFDTALFIATQTTEHLGLKQFENVIDLKD